NVSDCRFITGIIGLLDPATRRLTYVNAGHHAPFLITDTGVEQVKMSPTIPLGLDAATAYESATLNLASRPSTLVFFTDGVTEAENESEAPYGLERLGEVLQTVAEKAPAELVARVDASIRQYVRNQPQTDDITVMALRLD